MWQVKKTFYIYLNLRADGWWNWDPVELGSKVHISVMKTIFLRKIDIRVSEARKTLFRVKKRFFENFRLFRAGWPDQKVENQNFFFQNQNLSEFFFAKSEINQKGRFLQISGNYVNMQAPNTLLGFRSLIYTIFSKVFHFTITTTSIH